MTPPDIAAVVGLLAVAFGRRVDEQGLIFEVYEPALIDLDIEDPRGLILRLLKTLEAWPSPAVLRKALLAAHGVLPPDEDEAWRDALAFATSSGEFCPRDPDVLEAVRTVGGTWAIRTSDRGVIFAQFRDVYRSLRARRVQEILAADWGNRLPLPPGSQLQLSPPGVPGE